ncbi:VOC family protein [Streptomyces sp. T028]|uniref:VOC family protein n=1 Tax=Streptomyces sp. T028 TaxID=3394379 RepID=UPI003A8911CE
MPQITISHRTDKPLLDVAMLSHGTLASIDLQASREFYEEVFGLEVVQLSSVSILLRKGTDHTYVVVETEAPSTMTMLDHNGIDVASREAVDAAYETLNEVKDKYGIKRVNKIMEQHGSYSFYLQDRDGNWWEVQHGRPHGYAFTYAEGRDITGRTDIDPDAVEHVLDDEFAARLRSTR